MLRRTSLIGLGLLVATSAFAFEVPPNDGFVTDTAAVLSSAEESALEAKLGAIRTATSNEIAILIVPSLQGEEIADVSVEVGRKWGVGTAENDSGILILMSYEDKQIFMATGYGLEGAAPDIVVKGIVDTDMVPLFKEGKYAAGLEAGVTALEKHIAGEYTAERYRQQEGSVFSFWIVFAMFILIQWLGAIMARTKSWWLGGVVGGVLGVILTIIISFWLAIPIFVALGLGLDYLVSRNFKSRAKTKWWAGGGWGPGGSGGSRGGGFGGFGGGSFGGGGAGGHW